jgi:hypothetical protein
LPSKWLPGCSRTEERWLPLSAGQSAAPDWSPRNGFMLFGLMEALKAQGKDFAQVKLEFDAAWAKSDVKLSVAVL